MDVNFGYSWSFFFLANESMNSTVWRWIKSMLLISRREMMMICVTNLEVERAQWTNRFLCCVFCRCLNEKYRKYQRCSNNNKTFFFSFLFFSLLCERKSKHFFSASFLISVFLSQIQPFLGTHFAYGWRAKECQIDNFSHFIEWIFVCIIYTVYLRKEQFETCFTRDRCVTANSALMLMARTHKVWWINFPHISCGLTHTDYLWTTLKSWWFRTVSQSPIKRHNKTLRKQHHQTSKWLIKKAFFSEKWNDHFIFIALRFFVAQHAIIVVAICTATLCEQTKYIHVVDEKRDDAILSSSQFGPRFARQCFHYEGD